MRDRILAAHFMAGVKIMDPETTWVGPAVVLEPDVRLDPDVQVWGNSVLESGVVVGSPSILRNAIVSSQVTLVEVVLGDSAAMRLIMGETPSRVSLPAVVLKLVLPTKARSLSIKALGSRGLVR